MRTYADITVGSIVDGEIIKTREVVAPAAGRHAEIIRLTTHTGGRRTEFGDLPVDGLKVQHLADPTLVGTSDADLAAGVDVFAHNLRQGYSRDFTLEGLHGLALEMERRRAVVCIERGCERGGWRCQCHRFGRWS